MTYGEGKAVLILTAHRMNYAAGFVDDAQNLLEGKELDPIKMKRFESEANHLCDEILKDNKHKEGRKIANEIITEYQLQP